MGRPFFSFVSAPANDGHDVALTPSATVPVLDRVSTYYQSDTYSSTRLDGGKFVSKKHVKTHHFPFCRFALKDPPDLTLLPPTIFIPIPPACSRSDPSKMEKYSTNHNIFAAEAYALAQDHALL